jgi:hypothetical protein
MWVRSRPASWFADYSFGSEPNHFVIATLTTNSGHLASLTLICYRQAVPAAGEAPICIKIVPKFFKLADARKEGAGNNAPQQL